MDKNIRLPQLHCDADGRPHSRTGPRAWVDEEYKALHGMRRGATVSNDGFHLEPVIELCAHVAVNGRSCGH